ncbi:BTB/POZ domain-containing protein [Drechmeria coniospora]|uniref:BTB/POZ domain-containing protein n=1 Tax=Drechmeria coniospora TaxID=98403 RepID=A0A151GDX1_DRECN|nr:BTB/POZ domain-containing protein [Drechmeria coniospora]KYK55287.1 BTB/POZ domain-containing protein [Drechmeria coniospora]ODA82098.1 hypothetical protein RJ55_00603 [Drechmeria coniospora]
MATTTPSPSDGLDPSTPLPVFQPPVQTASRIPDILPHERVFPIQIGTELFKLSGASISSDAPSYFSQYFLCRIREAEEAGEDVNTAIRPLYIDRDPVTFRDIALHLQGYHTQPRNGQHFVRLFADAQFYSLPRLSSQLSAESVFASVGNREFQIPRDLLSAYPNAPNYFSLGFAAFFSRPDNLFPGLDRDSLLRPPAITPPSVPNRSPDTFAELLHMLRGYPLRVRDEAHRRELMRDARYFHFKGLEQQLVPHSITYNPLRRRQEIVLRLEHIQKSGISIRKDDGARDADQPAPMWVDYMRPFVDGTPCELIVEIGAEETTIRWHADGPRAEFYRDTQVRVAKLLQVMATKLSLPTTTLPLGLLMATGGADSEPATPGSTPLSEDRVRVSFGPESAVHLDGKPVDMESRVAADDAATVAAVGPRKRPRSDGHLDEPWTVKTAQWRLCLRASPGGKSALRCVLVAVKVDAVTSELGRNRARGFLVG